MADQEKEVNKEKFTKSVGVVIIRDGQVLLVRHTELARLPTGILGFPAGRVEEGETDKQGAIRELWEEAGLITTEENLIDIPENHFKSQLHLKKRVEKFDFVALVCTGFTGEIKPAVDGKTIPVWVDINNLPENILADVPAIINNTLSFLEKFRQS